MGNTVPCASCTVDLSVPANAHPGDVLTCPKCAGVRLRLSRKDGGWATTVVPTASCAVCDEILDLPDLIRAGEIVNHCDTPQKVLHEFGVFALEPIVHSRKA